MLKAMGVGAMVHAISGIEGIAQDSSAVFELRVYHVVGGRLPALLKRFREYTDRLFKKHGMTSVAYWLPTDEPLKGKTLYYVLKFPSREAATASWKAFGEDPEWVKAKTESEADGTIVERIESTFLELTDFSAKI